MNKYAHFTLLTILATIILGIPLAFADMLGNHGELYLGCVAFVGAFLLILHQVLVYIGPAIVFFFWFVCSCAMLLGGSLHDKNYIVSVVLALVVIPAAIALMWPANNSEPH